MCIQFSLNNFLRLLLSRGSKSCLCTIIIVTLNWSFSPFLLNSCWMYLWVSSNFSLRFIPISRGSCLILRDHDLYFFRLLIKQRDFINLRRFVRAIICWIFSTKWKVCAYVIWMFTVHSRMIQRSFNFFVEHRLYQFILPFFFTAFTRTATCFLSKFGRFCMANSVQISSLSSWWKNRWSFAVLSCRNSYWVDYLTEFIFIDWHLKFIR